MRRSAFTLIELVFVIVILGILAAVAVPRLAGVQDDATAATEDAGIGAVRSGLQGLRGRAILANGLGFNITVNDASGATHTIAVATTDLTSNNLNKLSCTAAWALSNADSANTDGTLATVMETGSRTQWRTRAPVTNDTRIAGPASSTIADASARYNTAGSWLYTGTTGVLVYQGATAY